ncbi:unnamed protein product, partial [Polarella glacialis]
VLHRWALQRGVGVIPKSATKARIFENAQLLDFQLSESAMRLLDGLATLSESGGAAQTKPVQQEDVYGLGRLSAPAGAAEPSPAMATTWGSSPDHGTQELLARTHNQGFPYSAIRDHLLTPPRHLSPGACQQQCLLEPRCVAWEVCTPFDPQAGCEGCYLIQAATQTIRVEGWYAAVESR